MRAIVIVILLSSVFMVGCASRIRNDKYLSTYESRFYWGRASFILWNRPTAGTSSEQQCDEANDTSRGRSSRQVAAALIFGACVKPGFNTDQMRQIISDGRWLDACRIEPDQMMSGGSLQYAYQGAHFRMWLFPDAQGQSDWIIFFTLSHGSPRSWGSGGRHPEPFRLADEAIAFLKGTHPDKGLRISEFEMHYPLYCIADSGRSKYPAFVMERHSARGVGIMISGYAPYD